MQGVTTVINGNCGNNVIPRHGTLERWQTRYPDNPIPEWNSYDDYIDLINSIKPSVNSAILIGHGSVRNGSGLKNQQRLPNLNEYDQMKGWIREGMEAVAVGFSTGLIYVLSFLHSMLLDPIKSKKDFYESELLRLNCNKAKRELKWQSILKFDEMVEMVANWYHAYYLDPKNIENVTEEQIIKYQSLAVKRGFKWAKIF